MTMLVRSSAAGSEVLPSGFHANNKYEVMKQNLKQGHIQLFQAAEVLLKDIKEIPVYPYKYRNDDDYFVKRKGQDTISRIVLKMGANPEKSAEVLDQVSKQIQSHKEFRLVDPQILDSFVKACLSSDGVNAKIYSPGGVDCVFGDGSGNERGGNIPCLSCPPAWPVIVLHALLRFPFWLASKISRFGKTASSLQVQSLLFDLKTKLNGSVTHQQLKGLVDRIRVDYKNVKFYASDSSQGCLKALDLYSGILASEQYSGIFVSEHVQQDLSNAVNSFFNLVSNYLLENRNGNTTAASKNSGKKLYRIMCEHLETFVNNPNAFVQEEASQAEGAVPSAPFVSTET